METTINPRLTVAKGVNSCRARWAEKKNNYTRELRALEKAMHQGGDEGEAAWEELANFGLSFDYVAPHTFHKQPRGYWRWQLCWGGPSAEFRFFGTPLRYEVVLDRIEFSFQDWFDGHTRKLTGLDEQLVGRLFQSLFVDSETATRAYEEALSE